VRSRVLTIALPRVTALVLALVLSTSACTSFSESLSGSATGSSAGRPTSAGSAATTVPDSALTVLADADPVATAAAMSKALFARSPVVVLARADDRAGVLVAASAAVGLGAPLLLEPGSGGVPDAVATEVARLGAGTVLAVGEADGGAIGSDTEEVVAVPADPAAVTEATGLEFGSSEPVDGDGAAAAVAALDPDGPAALRPEDAPRPTGDTGETGSVPAFERGDPLAGTVVLAVGGADSVAALATARAAGAQAVLTGGGTDPRSSTEVLDALAEADPDAVVALGAEFAAEEGLEWKLETAVTDARLPGGGQVLFPGRMLVALYGHPGTAALGVLGEQPVEAAVDRARAHAAPYESLVGTPVVPAFEIIATVASSSAGPDGNYSAEADPEVLRPWVDAAEEAGLYVLLDLQPGRTDFVTQAERYRSLLQRPHVGLALDPEWRLGPNEVHLTQVGSVDVEEVNRVVTWLADLTRENVLPQKLLVLHQFRVDMLPGRERLDLSRDELAVMVHADGQGSQGDKQATWRTLHGGASPSLFWGWKNFYDEDLPMLTPEQTLAQVSPRPDLVSYQ
jgi:hypothetical protein